MKNIKAIENINWKELPVFFQEWWLDIVCGSNNYEYLITKNGENVSSVSVIFKKGKLGISYLSMPPFTPYLGVRYFYPNVLKESSRLSFEEKVIKQLVGKLNMYSIVEFNLLPEIKNAFPFIKNGFRNHLRYTYIIRHSEGEEAYLKRMNQKLRKEIARNKIEVLTVDDSSEFVELQRAHLDKKEISNVHQIDCVRALDGELRARGKRKIYAARKGKLLLGAVYIVEDIKVNYCVFIAQNKQNKINGLVAKLVDVAIRETIRSGKDFDFEGSMIPGVEKFFRKFGGELTPYYVISKEKNVGLRILKQIKKKLIN